MTKPLSIAEQLLAAQVAIDGSMADAEILTAVSPYGYPLTRFQAAQELYKETAVLVNVQKREYGEQYGATQAMDAAWEAANAAYTITLKIARIAFKNDPNARQSLMLVGNRNRSFYGWLEQVDALYGNMIGHAASMAAMAPFGYDQPKLEAEAALVEAARVANLAQEREMGEAQASTRARDAKLDELNEWLADYKVIAAIALPVDGQKLEGLGFGSV